MLCLQIYGVFTQRTKSQLPTAKLFPNDLILQWLCYIFLIYLHGLHLLTSAYDICFLSSKYSTKTPIDFWCRWRSNLRSLMQPQETLPVELIHIENNYYLVTSWITEFCWTIYILWDAMHGTSTLILLLR